MHFLVVFDLELNSIKGSCMYSGKKVRVRLCFVFGLLARARECACSDLAAGCGAGEGGPGERRKLDQLKQSVLFLPLRENKTRSKKQQM